MTFAAAFALTFIVVSIPTLAVLWFMSHRQTLYELIEKQNHILQQILDAVRSGPPVLTSIRIRFCYQKFQGEKVMAEGPVTLNVGQSTVASIDGFDQNGAPWTGTIPPVTFTIDNSAVASSTPNGDGITDTVAGVSAGVANLTASLTTAEGLALTDTETVTVLQVAAKLSSIKINFSTPQ